MPNKPTQGQFIPLAAVKHAAAVMETVANGEEVHLKDFSDQVSDTTMDDLAAMIIREMCSEEKIRAFMRRNGIGVRK